MKFTTIINQMSLDEKVAFCSGEGFFSTKRFEQYGIPDIQMTDGPHGLRKQLLDTEPMGVNESFPSTCFPTASLIACSWDRDLLREMGAAIAEEALQEGVSIVLGPGVNIKRNPLCGRNFEYFSEDPFLSGEMGTAWIEGLQSLGVGASLKHFAANNQETERMSSDSIVDERTLREIYLPAFEIAVKKAQPATVMCAYNKLNGLYCSDNQYLLRKILREEWGFEGVILTDWGAMNDRVQAFEAGLDLEMPGSKGYFDSEVINAIRNGVLAEERLDESVDRLLNLIFDGEKNRKTGYRYDLEAHHQLAGKIAANSAVLLKNEDGILPLQKNQKIALIGALAKEPRYQGTGSSHVSPTKLTSAVDGFTENLVEFKYFDGYPLRGPGDEVLLTAAVEGTRQCEVAVIFAGLTEEYESEGFDRTSLAMPDSHNTLISSVAAANPNTVVVLVGGAPVEMPWLGEVKAVLNMYLSGQAGGLAAVDLLLGRVNPSGKLAESYPIKYADVPSAGFYESGGKQAQYREGIFVGYRYYDRAKKKVLFPFGHGLSYTTFEYSSLRLSHMKLVHPNKLEVSVTVRNTGNADGAEVVQLYISPTDAPVFRPTRELKEFAKVYLQAGESTQVSFSLDSRTFAIYDPGTGRWIVPTGNYRVMVGASSRDIRLQENVHVQGTSLPSNAKAGTGWYINPSGKPTQADFEALLGGKIKPPKVWKKGEYTLECTFYDMRDSFIVRQITRFIERKVAKAFGGVDYGNPAFKMIISSSLHTPLKNISQLSPDSMPKHVTEGIVHLANGNYLKGIVVLLKKN